MTSVAGADVQAAGPADFQVAVSAYLDHLRVERGLARQTLLAYASDLRLFGSRAPGIGRWATSAEPARAYLAARGPARYLMSRIFIALASVSTEA